jgi:exodeoxyribonuclease VII small subunit
MDEASGPTRPAAKTGTEPESGSDPNADISALPFDKALAELQAVVGRLEAGGLQLEESIALYERGVALHDHCSTLLTGAELRVQRLVEGAGGSLRTIDLRPDDEA